MASYTWEKYSVIRTFVVTTSGLSWRLSEVGTVPTTKYASNSPDSRKSTVNVNQLAVGDYFQWGTDYFRVSVIVGDVLEAYKCAITTDKGSYIELVTSSVTDAYPENGEKDGYWYVYTRVVGEPEVYATIDGVAQKLTAIPAMVDGVLRELGSLYSCVDGVLREVFAKAISSGLPVGYTLCEYIESDGKAYLDTNFIPNQDTRVVCEVAFVTADGYRSIFGAWTSDYKNAYAAQAHPDDYFVSFYGTYDDRIKTNSSGVVITPGDKFVIDKNKNVFNFNGSSVAHPYITLTSPSSLFIFANSAEGAVEDITPLRIYSFTIYDNGTMVRDFVPCINPSGKYGLYDLVTQEFYGNAGMGAFTGKAPAQLISFTVDGVACQGAEGMTWAEWCASSYNTIGLYVDGTFVFNSAGDCFIYSYDLGLYAEANDVIADGTTWELF